MVYGLLSDAPEVPAALVRACEQQGLALLRLAIEVPFAQVSETLARLQAAERERGLSASIVRGEALLQAVAAGAPEAGAIAVLTRELALPVAVLDPAGRVLAADGLDPTLLDVRAVGQAVSGPTRAEMELRGGSVAAIFRIEGASGPEALLVCARALVDLTAEQRGALEQTARFLALELGRRQSVSAVEARFAGELVEMLTDVRRTQELPGRLRSYGLDPGGPLVAVSIAADAGSRAGLVEDVRRLWAANGGSPVVVAAGADDVVAVLGWAGTAEALHRTAEEVLDELVLLVPGTRAVAGLGRLSGGHGGLPLSLAGARDAREVAWDRSEAPVVVVAAPSAGSFRSLLSLQDPELLDEFVLAVLAPLRRHDRQHATELELTVRTFLDTGGRWNATASELHVHVNTLRNRLRRIEELTGRDLQRTEDRVDLHLALHVSGR